MNSMEINITSVTIIIMLDYFPQAPGIGVFFFERLAPCTIKCLTLYMWWKYFIRKKKSPGHKQDFVCSYNMFQFYIKPFRA